MGAAGFLGPRPTPREGRPPLPCFRFVPRIGGSKMIFGAHVLVYSKDAEADRAFFREVLGLASVDAGHGWLIFALPPAEAAFHPAEENDRHELYFMCADLKAEMSDLASKNVICSPVEE